MPIVFEGELRGVVELASLESFSPSHQAFLDQLMESIGIVIHTIEANTRTETLLTQSQSLAEELQQTNQALEEKATQLALTSKYKSEFLANMSHELRTPLNSLLLLSDKLAKNPEGNLSLRQVESAKTIHASGNDLLALINDILDLSKIESGTVVADISELRLLDLQRYVERTFRHVAEAKQVAFEVYLDPHVPRTMLTDIKRMQQIIKNLLSNAFKFTHEGSVSLSVGPAAGGWSPDNEELAGAEQVIAFSVTDTGIGIAPDKQQIIFEAFQQADGSTSRKYGGTGLGLAISRELSKLLGGEIKLVSSPGEGSTFTLYLPAEASRAGRATRANPAEARTVPALAPVPAPEKAPVQPLYAEDELRASAVNEAGDDRASIHPGDRTILIVENDLAFAKVLLDAARRQGFKGLVSATAAAAISLIKEYMPTIVSLDIFLPDMPGWRILDRLKADLSTRHIPICIVSTDDSRDRALSSGAIGFITKPVASTEVIDEAIAQLADYVARPRKRVCLAMAPGGDLELAQGRFAESSVDVVTTTDTAEICDLLSHDKIDCLVVESGATDLQPADLIEIVEQRVLTRQLPIVIYGSGGGDALSRWRRRDGMFALREARSLERLMDAVYFSLHRSLGELSESERRAIEDLHRDSRALEGKKALVVDDDMRNIFALSTVLHDHGMEIISANNGREAIRLVQEDPSIDIVLMDIMMPEMDGMTTMREIRKLEQRKDLPIIAVTAKAMKGDREKCIEAGAWDYLSKPVDTIHLLGVLKSWLHR
jgi:signal transduction histidine kinase/DNA-binding response OmpR family regulator